MEKTRVMFLCTGNSARSQMAEALLRHYAGDTFEVYSAGLEPKDIHPLTLRVLQEIGLDTSTLYSKPLSEFMGKVHFGYLITVCDRADKNCPIFPGMGKRLAWPFEDPALFEGSEEERLTKFREVRDLINIKVKAWLKEMGIESDEV